MIRHVSQLFAVFFCALNAAAAAVDAASSDSVGNASTRIRESARLANFLHIPAPILAANSNSSKLDDMAEMLALFNRSGNLNNRLRRDDADADKKDNNNPGRINYNSAFSNDLKIEHNTDEEDVGTFKLKYLYNLNYYKNDGPVLLYLGKDIPIEVSAKQKSGILYDMAMELNAAIVFLEHRYYSKKSAPFGSKSYKEVETLKYLTSKQALGDIVEFVPFMRRQLEISNSAKIFAIGSGYGGSLATWLRKENPDIIDGAWASSAPFLMFEGGNIGYEKFGVAIHSALVKAGCNSTLLDAVFLQFSNTSITPEMINKIFRIAEKSKIETRSKLAMFLHYIYDQLMQITGDNHWYSVGSMPKRPAQRFCKHFSGDESTVIDKKLETLSEALDDVFGTNEERCIDPTVCDGIIVHAQRFQKCTETIYSACRELYPGFSVYHESSSCHDKFEMRVIGTCALELDDLKEFSVNLVKFYAVKKNHGFDIAGKASNIIFTNGKDDPFRVGGAVAKPELYATSTARNSNIFSFLNAGGVHALELRRANKCDPKPIVKARVKIVQILKCWSSITSTFSQEMSSVCDGINSEAFMDTGPLQIKDDETCEDETRGYPWSLSDDNWKTIEDPDGEDTGNPEKTESDDPLDPKSNNAMQCSFTPILLIMLIAFISTLIRLNSL